MYMQAELSKKYINQYGISKSYGNEFNDILKQLYQAQVYISRRSSIWDMLQNS